MAHPGFLNFGYSQTCLAWWDEPALLQWRGLELELANASIRSRLAAQPFAIRALGFATLCPCLKCFPPVGRIPQRLVHRRPVERQKARNKYCVQKQPLPAVDCDAVRRSAPFSVPLWLWDNQPILCWMWCCSEKHPVRFRLRSDFVGIQQAAAVFFEALHVSNVTVLQIGIGNIGSNHQIYLLYAYAKLLYRKFRQEI